MEPDRNYEQHQNYQYFVLLDYCVPRIVLSFSLVYKLNRIALMFFQWLMIKTNALQISVSCFLLNAFCSLKHCKGLTFTLNIIFRGLQDLTEPVQMRADVVWQGCWTFLSEETQLTAHVRKAQHTGCSVVTIGDVRRTLDLLMITIQPWLTIFW